MSTCRKRVWDNGDMTDCDAPTHAPSGLCRKHANEKRDALLQRTRELRIELAEAETVLENISRELGYL